MNGALMQKKMTVEDIPGDTYGEKLIYLLSQTRQENRRNDMATLYETDFTRWTFEQAEALRAGRVTVAELEHIAEVLEEVGSSEKSAVESQLSRLLMHLLKWKYQPDVRAYSINSWRATIREARKQLSRRAASGMLARHAVESFAWCYGLARDSAAAETNLPEETFPAECPWTFEQVTDITFYPGESE